MEIKNKILDAFKDYEFIDETHTYYYKGEKVSISTTGLIHQYSNEFDKWEMSANVARKRGMSQLEVLEEWRIENLHSTIKGSMIHEFAQSLWEGKDYIFKYDNIPDEINIRRLQEELLVMSYQAINFYKDYKDLYDLVGCEIYLGVPDFDECGATDMLLKNKFTEELLVIDFKSNKRIDYESFGHKKMKVPLQKYEDCNYIHYSIQLNAYSYKIEYMTGIKVKEKLLIYFDCTKDNYEVIEPLEMKKEVIEIYENRRVKNMKSIPVLIMGASGTGKTFSFKNLPPKETAIISIAKSELPFRNKTGLKFVECDNYDVIMKAIQETDKRIICIDDSGFLMQFEKIEKSMIKGYDKFTEMAKHYADLLKTIRKLDGEKIVYLVMHEELEDEVYKPKTVGKLLNDSLCIEGLFNIVLRATIKDGNHYFQTRSDGTSVAKTPYEMFDEELIPNDLNEVDKVIRDYYGFKPIENEERESEK